MFKNTNELYKLQNTYKNTLPILRLKIVNTDIAHKHNSDMRAKALVQYQQEKKERKNTKREDNRRAKREGFIKIK